MNILVIGNGFDLAHGLPTTYSDFLKFFEIIMNIEFFIGDKKMFKEKYLDCYQAPSYVREYVENAFDTRNIELGLFDTCDNAHNTNSSVQEMHDYLKDNIWYDYLLDIFNQKQMKGINWIDFESEISLIIEQIDKFQENLYMPFDITATDENEKLGIFLSKLDLKRFMSHKIESSVYGPTYRDFLDKSYGDLRKFVRCMALYLSECVEKCHINRKSQDVAWHTIDAVLCFNYTHTFIKMYGKICKCKIHYIHGDVNDADYNMNANNMVLGIDEYYDLDERNKHTNYNIYKKFTQRILNNTGLLYRDWISQMDENTREFQESISSKDVEKLVNNVYIFGHSLDVTDKDVIKDLIDRKGVKTTIYYFDKQQQTQQIANLVKMLGQEKFIDMINSVPQKICFVQQQPMKDIG